MGSLLSDESNSTRVLRKTFLGSYRYRLSLWDADSRLDMLRFSWTLRYQLSIGIMEHYVNKEIRIACCIASYATSYTYIMKNHVTPGAIHNFYAASFM